MGSRRIAILGGVLGAQAVVFGLTSYLDGLGARGWHHVASLLAVLGLAALFWRPLSTSRRWLAFGVTGLTVLAAASGFWLLYWKEGIRAAGHQDWGVFWHVAWSWAAAVFFFMHTWINRVAFAYYLRRSFARRAGALLHASAYAALVAAFAVTWSGLGKDWFTVESYIPLTLYAWLVATTPAYGAWLLSGFAGARTRLAGRLSRAQVRGPVDLALVPAAALATLSGVPLTWFDPIMDENGWKYVSKFWHVWPSVLFSVLVFAHSVHAWRTMRAHWHRYGIAVGDTRRRSSMDLALPDGPHGP